MRVSRLFIDAPLSVGNTATGDVQVKHYLANVLRLKAGAYITLFNGDGNNYKATIADIQKKHVEFTIHDSEENLNESPLKITLAQGIGKGDRMDFAVQKATELGVTSIIPIFTEFSAVKLNEERQLKRQAHWQEIAINAAQQSERAVVPTIQPCKNISEFISDIKPCEAIKLVLHPYQAKPIKSVSNHASGQVILIVGPEGGLSEGEVRMAEQADFTSIALGKRILRTETACTSAITLAQYLWGDF